MLQALLERGIMPDLIVGTSVGALNGVAVAAEPTLEMVRKLRQAWMALGKERVESEVEPRKGAEPQGPRSREGPCKPTASHRCQQPA